MNSQFPRLVVGVAAIVAVVSIGCQKKNREPQNVTAAATSKQTTPEESFESIVEMFRRGVEDIPIGFRVDDGSGGRTLMTGRNVVTHQLIPPANDGDSYRAEITVESQSEYSLQRSNTSPAGQSGAGEPQAADGSDIQDLDPSLASSPGAGNAPSAKTDKSAVTVARNEEKDKRTYKLVYENGRWKLLSKLDPNTEGSIKFAFERALASQG